MLQRQTKSSGYVRSSARDDFIKYCYKYIDDNFHPVDSPNYAEDPSILHDAYDFISKMKRPVAFKADLTRQLDKFADVCIGEQVPTSADVFVKPEMTFGDSIGRCISARIKPIRCLSAALYKHIEHQVYANTHMVKHIDQHELVNRVADRLAGYQNDFGLDASSFDSG